MSTATKSEPKTTKADPKLEALKPTTTHANGLGRRKSSVARVTVSAGSGKVTVNGQPATEYFVTESQRVPMTLPFAITETVGKFDVSCKVNGGGKVAQADAVMLGIARALVRINADFDAKLKAERMLTRDPRMKERKKYGRHGARRGTQFSKR
jgi:small subunit ribosomal protein S9